MLGAACLAALAAAPLRADSPKVRYLFPTGGSPGATVVVTAEGARPAWPVRAAVDRPGLDVRLVEDGKKAGQLEVRVASDAAPGCYWVRVYNAEGAAPPVPFIVDPLPAREETEPNEGPANAEPLDDLPAIVSARLQKSGDVDAYRVRLAAGQPLVVRVAANTLLGSPVDPVVQVANPAGIVLAQNDDDRGLDPGLVFVAPAEGAYLVRVFGFPAEPNSTIALAGGEDYVYRLTLTAGPEVRYAWPLAVASGAGCEVALYGPHLPAAGLTRHVPAQATGKDHVLGDAGATGTAAVAVTDLRPVVEAEPNGPDAPQTLALGSLVTGRLGEPRDADVYRLEGKRGDAWMIRVAARALGFPTDPTLRITNAAGAVFADHDDTGGGRDAERAFTLPADGEFRIVVRDLFGHGGDEYLYRLEVRPQRPQAELAVAASEFTLDPAKPLEIPVTIGRLEGLDADLTVAVEGLPKGVAAEPVPSKAKEPSGKSVTLRLAAGAEAAAFSGPIAIVARTADGQAAYRARAKLRAPGATTDGLWLTVLPRKAAAKK